MFKTCLKYRVPYADTDQMGVVYYANYFVFFERARNEMLREAGLPYVSFEEQGIMLPVIEAHCDYKNAACYDDELEIYVGFAEVKGCRIKVVNEIYCNGKLLVKGYTRHAFISSETRKPIKAPDHFYELITARLEE